MPAIPDLSILIVNFNNQSLLRDLLQSIDATKADLTIQTIVFDNASSDGSPRMIAAEFPGVVLEASAVNLGFAKGNNRAARLATAPFLFLLNNDTRLRPGALQSLLQFLRDTPDAVAVGPELVGGDGLPQRSGRNLPTLPAMLNSIQFLKWTGLFRSAYRRYRRGGDGSQSLVPIPQLAAAALLIRREAFDRCGGFDDAYEFGVEDVDLCRRLGQFGRIYYLPAARVDHHGRVSSHANRSFVYRGYECGWARYFRIHHGRGAGWIYKALVTLDMPVRIVLLALQSTGNYVVGRKGKGKRDNERLRAALQFIGTGLPKFWRA